MGKIQQKKINKTARLISNELSSFDDDDDNPAASNAIRDVASIIVLGSGAIFRHYLHSSLSPLVQDWFFSLLSFSSLGCWSVVLCGEKNKGYVSLRLTIGAVTRFDNSSIPSPFISSPDADPLYRC